MNKLYRQVKLTDEEHDDFVFPHIMGMTGEKLHSKAEIAEELGVRDKRIAELKARVAELEQALQRQTKRVKLLEPLLDSEPKKEAIRDLEQQLKVADSFLNMSQVSGRFGRGAISEADAMRKRNKIFKELQALKETKDDE